MQTAAKLIEMAEVVGDNMAGGVHLDLYPGTPYTGVAGGKYMRGLKDISTIEAY